MTFRAFATLAFCLAALTGCPGPAAPKRAATSRTPVRSAPVAVGPTGEEAYRSSCSACHGPDARGLPNIGKDLVTGEFSRTQTDEALLAFVKQGRAADDPANTTHVAMPPRGGNPALTDDAIRAIIAYMRTLQQAAPQGPS